MFHKSVCNSQRYIQLAIEKLNFSSETEAKQSIATFAIQRTHTHTHAHTDRHGIGISIENDTKATKSKKKV